MTVLLLTRLEALAADKDREAADCTPRYPHDAVEATHAAADLRLACQLLRDSHDERRAWTARIGELERALAGAAERAWREGTEAAAKTAEASYFSPVAGQLIARYIRELEPPSALAPAHSPEPAEGA